MRKFNNITYRVIKTKIFNKSLLDYYINKFWKQQVSIIGVTYILNYF